MTVKLRMFTKSSVSGTARLVSARATSLRHISQQFARIEGKESRNLHTSGHEIQDSQHRAQYWQKVKPWENVSEQDFLSYRWQVCFV
jgi:hypothetical protein